MGEKLSLNPWMSIWTRPRETIRAILHYNSSYLLPLLYWIYGVPLLLQAAQNFGYGMRYPLMGILIGVCVGAIVLGFIGIQVGAGMFYLTGKWIGGVGTFREVRAAVAWSSVPVVVNIGIWAVQIAMFGNRLFTPYFFETTFVGAVLATVFIMSVAQVVLTVWGFVILLKALSEVQQFSTWKAFFNLCIPIVIIFVAAKLLTYLFVLIAGGRS